MAVSKRYNMLMSNEAYEAFTDIAAQRNQLLADVIREALDNYLQANNKPVSSAVDRGGNRRAPKSNQEKE